MLRRFGFFCIWIVFASIAYGVIIGIIAVILLPEYTLYTNRMPKPIEAAANGLYSIMFIGLAVLASKGFLPGAKRKKNVSKVIREKATEENWF